MTMTATLRRVCSVDVSHMDQDDELRKAEEHSQKAIEQIRKSESHIDALLHQIDQIDGLGRREATIAGANLRTPTGKGFASDKRTKSMNCSNPS